MMVMHSAGLLLRPAASWFTLPRAGLICLLALLFLVSLRGAELADAREQLLKGQYQECFRNCQQAIADQEYRAEWRLLAIQALLETGAYTNALELLTANLDRYSSSVQMRLLGHEVYLRNGETERAATLLQEINQLAGTRSWAYRSPADLVALGRTALLLVAEPRKVPEIFFAQ